VLLNKEAVKDLFTFATPRYTTGNHVQVYLSTTMEVHSPPTIPSLYIYLYGLYQNSCPVVYQIVNCLTNDLLNFPLG